MAKPAPHVLNPEKSVSRETRGRLLTLADITLKWNKSISLISRADESRIWERHIEDSLTFVSALPHSQEVMDLGSGAGYPGLVIAIATGRTIDLVEADQRKAAFLLEAARVTAARVRVHSVRIESLVTAPVEIITARALAPLPRLLDYAFPHLKENGSCLFSKGPDPGVEVSQAKTKWDFALKTYFTPTGTLLEISRLNRR